MELLSTSIQQYAWGKNGKSSAVATLKHAQAKQLGESFEIDESQSYAELWIGTHVNGPSKVHSSGESLSDYVQKDPSVLGEKLTSRFGGQSLPFLLKVLSVKQALSIQAHPDKTLAEKLHRERPDVYKDPNHKPEMTIAITPFEVLCGFRKLKEIEGYLDSVPELKEVLQGECTKLESEADLRVLFGKLMLAEEELVKKCVAKLADRLEKLEKKSALQEAILRVHAKYPGDVGNFCPFLLNHFVLAPGEAVFLGPNEPHAYLSGNCVECMATSDNVVRAGLTPKLRDTNTLIGMLTYKVRDAKPLEAKIVNESVMGYYPPVPDFQVEICRVKESLVMKAKAVPCVGLVGEGEGEINGKKVTAGSSVFVPCGLELKLSGNLQLFLATVNESMLE